MYVVFKVELKEDCKEVTPLFISEDSSVQQTLLLNVITALKEAVPEEYKDRIKFVSLYAGTYTFYDSSKKYLDVLTRLENGIPQEILYIQNKYDSYLSTTLELLNSENTVKNRSYEIFNVHGELKK